MPRYRFSDNRGRSFHIHDDFGRIKLYLDGDRRNLEAQPLKASVVTALLQEVVRGCMRMDLLNEIEWLGHKSGSDGFCCLWCDMTQSEGHTKNCKWLKARGGQPTS